mmetsp:Transcript_7814/g.16208  ORF Transcript_7814/g.16208 Transcript_7814/m.16208 type:complete len:242 (-) Transcript_7814:992-1717(-)
MIMVLVLQKGCQIGLDCLRVVFCIVQVSLAQIMSLSTLNEIGKGSLASVLEHQNDTGRVSDRRQVSYELIPWDRNEQESQKAFSLFFFTTMLFILMVFITMQLFFFFFFFSVVFVVMVFVLRGRKVVEGINGLHEVGMGVLTLLDGFVNGAAVQPVQIQDLRNEGALRGKHFMIGISKQINGEQVHVDDGWIVRGGRLLPNHRVLGRAKINALPIFRSVFFIVVVMVFQRQLSVVMLMFFV